MNLKALISLLSSAEGFDWDGGNASKNEKHGVEQYEIEQAFFDPNLLMVADIKHSKVETRHIAYGSSGTGRILTIVFTMRGKKIRPISARDSNRRERQRYEEKEAQNDSEVSK